MKASRFKEYTNEKTLQELVKATLEGKEISKVVRTPFGEVYRDILPVQADKRVWNVIRSPTLISQYIPGLEDFTCEGMHVGAPIKEEHFMFLSTNKYEGRIFFYDKERKIWGMTNHPTNDHNKIDIPHNVVYHFDENASRASIGVDYCSSGRLGSNPLVRAISRASMRYAMQRVANRLKSGEKIKCP